MAANLAAILGAKAAAEDSASRRRFAASLAVDQFGLGIFPGLSEWLQGESRPIQHIYRLEGPNLWLLPAGRPPENPLELMQSGRLSELLKQLSTWFDWIIIDSPPILPLADTSVWARLADGILLVTREGTTKKRMLQQGLQALEQSKLLGAVVNHPRIPIIPIITSATVQELRDKKMQLRKNKPPAYNFDPPSHCYFPGLLLPRRQANTKQHSTG